MKHIKNETIFGSTILFNFLFLFSFLCEYYKIIKWIFRILFRIFLLFRIFIEHSQIFPIEGVLITSISLAIGNSYNLRSYLKLPNFATLLSRYNFQLIFFIKKRQYLIRLKSLDFKTHKHTD